MPNNNNARTSQYACGVMLMPMKDVYEMMHEDAVNARNALAFADSAKSVRNVLSAIYGYHIDNRVSDHIKHMIQDIKGTVRSMHTHDYTREQMCNDLSVLVTALEDAIAQEEHNECVKSIRNIFLVMADHAEEITSWLEEYEKQ